MTTIKTDFRPISNAGIHRVIGKLYSRKNHAHIPWESQLERDFFLTCEYARWVTAYQAQAEPVYLWVNGERRRYTGDARLQLAKVNRADPSRCVVEVKTDEDYARPEVRELLDAAELHHTSEDCRFEVFLASRIRVGFRIPNLRALYRYAGVWVSEEVRGIVSTLITDASEPTVGWVADRLKRHGITVEPLFSLMFHGDVDFELEKEPLSYDTLLTWSPR